MTRHQIDAANEQEAREMIAALPEAAAGDETALCCSACGAVLERTVAPMSANAALYGSHECGAPRASEVGGGGSGERGAGPPPGGEVEPEPDRTP